MVHDRLEEEIYEAADEVFDIENTDFEDFLTASEKIVQDDLVAIPDRPPVQIESFDEDGNVVEKIKLMFPQPNIAVDTGTRTVEHDIIGDKTVIQKMGENATEVSIEGICTKDEAQNIDKLELQPYIRIVSYRWEGYMILDSTSTSPISEGGAIMGSEGTGFIYKWTHEFSLSGKSVKNPQEEWNIFHEDEDEEEEE